ncbi:MAG: ester cyclase, partial [Acidimicrobiia bacterium]
MSEQTEANKDIVRRYQDAYNESDLDTVAELLDPEWKSNSFPSEVLPQTVENLKVLQDMLLGAFPDIHFTTH